MAKLVQRENIHGYQKQNMRERGEGGEEGGRMGERQVEMTDIPFISAREKYGMSENLCGVNTSKFDNIFLYL